MQRNVCSLTVFFEDPFWVGVLQRTDGTRLEVCKITFGAEPKDYEVYEFLLTNWGRFRFSPMLPDDGAGEKKVNSKRMRRAISRELQKRGVSTKAQMALQLQREQGKQEQKQLSQAKCKAEQERRFLLKQEKRKKKHRGR